MSVLLAYGDSEEAVIMSDSRITFYDKNNLIIGHDDHRQKIFKISNNFIIGAVGDARAKGILENINIYIQIIAFLNICSSIHMKIS